MKTQYVSDTICPKCETKTRYVKNDRCVRCAQIEAGHFYNFTQGHAKFTEAGFKYIADPFADVELLAKAQRRFDLALSYAICPKTFTVPTSAPAAKALGLTRFVTPHACRAAGHLGIKTLNGKCYFCQTVPKTITPRLAAKAKGERWYTPSEPCGGCGQLAPRYVANGRCKGCQGGEQKRDETEQLMALQPDLIISRDDAIKLGLKVYRTGKACKNGHAGYRYVSTRACVECRR